MSEDNSSFSEEILRLIFFVKTFFCFFFPSNNSGTFEEIFFAAMLKLTSRCPQRNNRSFLFRKQNLFQFFFRTLSRRVPIFGGKFQAVLSENAVALLEEFFEGKVILTKKFCFFNNHLEKDSWSICFGTCVRFASLVLNVKCCGEKKTFKWNISYLFFYRNVREFSGHLAKNPEFFGKSFLRVEKTAFFFIEKNVREINFFGKKAASIKLSDLTKKIQKFCWNFFSAVLSEDSSSFLEEFLRLKFFCKYFFLFLFHLTFLGPSLKYFLQWC